MPVEKTKRPSAAKTAPASNLASMGRSPAPQQVGREEFLVAQPDAPFFYRHHPSEWDVSTVDGKPVFLPVVGVQRIVGGANGMRSAKKNAPPTHQFQLAQDRGRNAGWVYLDQLAPIPAEFLPDGVPAGGYLREYPCRAPVTGQAGSMFLEAWTIPIETPPGKPQKYKFDRPKFDAWRAHLVESGQIQPPVESVLEALRDRAQTHLERAEAADVRPAVLKDRQRAAETVAAAVVPGAA